MISTNALSVFILHCNLNKLGNKNIFSIEEIMHTSEPATNKFKRFARISLIL